MIDGSSRTYILSEDDIIVMRSMKKYLKRKISNHYKRCYTLLSTSMKGLHLARSIMDIGISEKAINNLQQ